MNRYIKKAMALTLTTVCIVVSLMCVPVNLSGGNVILAGAADDTITLRECNGEEYTDTGGGEDDDTIDLESVNRAILLAEYFRTTAVKVQTAVSQEQLSELHRNIYLNLPLRFTTAEGIGIAESYGMKENAFKMFLKRHIGTLFRKENHGEYSK